MGESEQGGGDGASKGAHICQSIGAEPLLETRQHRSGRDGRDPYAGQECAIERRGSTEYEVQVAPPVTGKPGAVFQLSL